MTAFKALYKEYQDLGVEILAINVDDEAEKANVLLQDIEVSFPVLFDTSGEVSQLYDVRFEHVYLNSFCRVGYLSQLFNMFHT